MRPQWAIFMIDRAIGLVGIHIRIANSTQTAIEGSPSLRSATVEHLKRLILFSDVAPRRALPQRTIDESAAASCCSFL